ncbi:hypothetical protein UFOVP402_38 [uncultured Caudovirales phage]|uniref:Phosphoadenosine phosphosulphate reductase domain-containing protein n=1 Tax=uncultured Caudovirales phage TaxID=2100421 RepID=A0A6J5M1A2_9CAUD|nr:hypothetical protein UFOVP402_38 [uncultured Caudovirales phage]
MKEKLLISFSGGRTSAYMMWYMLNEWEDRSNYDIKIVFANTGLEEPGTLLFVHNCSIKWGIDIVWVEARHRDENGKPFSTKGWKVKHQIVDYFTAARCQKLTDGNWAWTPFEEMISVLGIPSTNAPFCSDQLKRIAIESYLKSIGWDDFYKAIGIRVDEVDRISEGFRKKKIIYPLIKNKPTFKRDVIIWWDKQDFDLNIDADFGNCNFCWKKDMNRLVRCAIKKPDTFQWWQDMADKYGMLNPRNIDLLPPFNFYRGNLSPKDILKLSELELQQLDLFIKEEKLNGCDESCEAF